MSSTTSTTLTTLLNQVLRNHLTVVSQLFLHDLVAVQWGEDAIHDRYAAEYLPDISRLFRMLEHLLDAGYIVTSGDPDKPYAEAVARVGRTVPETLDIDHALLLDIQAAMQEGAAQCQKVGDRVEADLLSEAVETRAKLINWIESERQSQVIDASDQQLVPPNAGTSERSLWEQVNVLLCRLLVIIDQTVCHTFAFRHKGDEGAANTTWQISWQSMRDTASIVNLMVARAWAIDTVSAARANNIFMPIIVDDVLKIAEIDSALHRMAASDAERCVELARSLGDADFERVCLDNQRNQETSARGAIPSAAQSYPGLQVMTKKWAYVPAR